MYQEMSVFVFSQIDCKLLTEVKNLQQRVFRKFLYK